MSSQIVVNLPLKFLNLFAGELWGDPAVAAEVSEASAIGPRPGDGYNTLTNREESDLKKFFDRTTSEDIFDADSLMRNLQKYLFDAEGVRLSALGSYTSI